MILSYGKAKINMQASGGRLSTCQRPGRLARLPCQCSAASHNMRGVPNQGKFLKPSNAHQSIGVFMHRHLRKDPTVMDGGGGGNRGGSPPRAKKTGENDDDSSDEESESIEDILAKVLIPHTPEPCSSVYLIAIFQDHSGVNLLTSTILVPYWSVLWI